MHESSKAIKVKYVYRYTPKQVIENPRSLYVYGDNDLEKGKKGQACIRGLRNTVGIKTKKAPSMSPSAYYTDNELMQNAISIDIGIMQIRTKLASGLYDTLILPQDGLGTGLANLPVIAPKTHKYLVEQIQALVDSYK